MTSVTMKSTKEIQWRGRLGSRGGAKCALDAPLLGRAEHAFTTKILDLNIFGHSFLPLTARRLHCGAEGAQEPS